MTVTASTDTGFAPVPWRDHYSGLQWRQGEHVLLAAPTGAGKTSLARKLADKRSHVVMLVTKTHDETIRKDFAGWDRIHAWSELKPWHTKVLLWPKPGKTLAETLGIQRTVMRDALDGIGRGNRSGWSGWGVIVDESHYMTDPSFLNLNREIAMLHHVGRSAGISMLDLTQRPAWIPKIIYSSVSHAYIARTRDVADLKRLADLGGIDPRTTADNVTTLSTRHDYVYVSPQTDALPSIVNIRK